MGLKLKICGMRDPANLAAVAALQPDYLGFIFYPKSKRYVGDMPPETLRSIPSGIRKTGVFVNENADVLEMLARKYGLDAVQLHGQESPVEVKHLKAKLPSLQLIKAFGINEDFNFEVLKDYVAAVDYFLFDTQTPEHGGSGLLFDWSLLDRYSLPVPFFLSGGIGPDSVAALQALHHEQLYALDVNSKFETAPALKDVNTLKNFKHQLFS